MAANQFRRRARDRRLNGRVSPTGDWSWAKVALSQKLSRRSRARLECPALSPKRLNSRFGYAGRLAQFTPDAPMEFLREELRKGNAARVAKTDPDEMKQLMKENGPEQSGVAQQGRVENDAALPNEAGGMDRPPASIARQQQSAIGSECRPDFHRDRLA